MNGKFLTGYIIGTVVVLLCTRNWWMPLIEALLQF